MQDAEQEEEMKENKDPVNNLVPKIEEAEILPSKIGEIPESAPIRLGNYYVYEVNFEKAGWRIIVLPVPWEKAFNFEPGSIYYKGLFTLGRVADVTWVHVGWLYSTRAQTTVPVFYVISSDWHARNYLSVKSLSEKGYNNPEDFAKIIIALDKYQAHELATQLLETQRRLEVYKQKYERSIQDIDKLADDRAAEIVIDYMKMLEAVSKQLSSGTGLLELIKDYLVWILLAVLTGFLFIWLFMA